MSIKGIIIFLLVTTIAILGVLSIVFLASAALHGAYILPVVCLGFLFLFFYGVSFLNKDHKV
ncbi:MAG: hypothetical protein M3139_14375 [Bacteroidota bacterium]|nr:hypothetical protein [Bacteroidota bacterium]